MSDNVDPYSWAASWQDVHDELIRMRTKYESAIERIKTLEGAIREMEESK